jgi:hypothetical protein
MSGDNRICCKCNVELEEKSVLINYMGISMNVRMPRCPSCGQVYMPRELVKGKLAEVEKELELK